MSKESDERRSRLQKIGMAAGVLVAVFLLGYVPSYRSALMAERQQALLAQQLKLARLHSQLGMISFEVNRNNYSQAAQYSTDFFDHLGTTLNEISEAALKEKLQTFGARRDEVTAYLAKADPSVKGTLAQMYADFYPLVATP